MALSGDRLKTALAADVLTQLQAQFPIAGDLQAAEKTLLQTAQQKLATAIANAAGPDVVTEVANGLVTLGTASVISGVGAGGSVTGTGSIT